MVEWVSQRLLKEFSINLNERDNIMSEAIRYEKDSDNIVLLTLDDPDQSANTMNDAYKTSMEKVLTRLEGEEGLAGVVITSAKKTFFAGGDLNTLIKVQPEHADEFMAEVTSIKGQLRRLELLKVPVVAAINGAALGGGFEICLACNYRIAIDNPNIKLGLPEVTLGLLPGAGGVVRMTRMLGIEKASPFLLEGKQVNPKKAMAAGMINELAADQNELIAKAKAWCSENKYAKQPWDTANYKVPGGTPSSPKLAPMLAVMPAMLSKKTKGCYPAPEAIMSVAVESLQVDFDTANKIESRYFTKLATGKISKNMITAFFFQLQEINKGASRPSAIEKNPTKKVGILGAGMMGAGIAYVSAMSGIEVVLKDVSLENAEKGKLYAEALLKKRLSRGQISKDKLESILSMITPTGDASDLAGCDLVIEAVFEDRKLKALVTKEAEIEMLQTGVMASNTSTLPITGLAEASIRPSNFIGLHFFSPVDKMPLVEIICGNDTSDEALAKAFDYVAQIKKTPIVVNDSRGFFTSRVFGHFIMEGVGMLGEGLNPASIEMAAARAGFPIGTLAILDELSLELTRKLMLQTKTDYEAEGKTYVAHPAEAVIERLIELGRSGKSVSNAGFYDYPETGKKMLWPGLNKEFGKNGKEIPFEDMQERLLFIQAIDAVRCLDENVLTSIADANIGSIMGIGFPPWTGGVIQYINQYGLQEFVQRAEALAASYGERFIPPASLVLKAEKGECYT